MQGVALGVAQGVAFDAVPEWQASSQRTSVREAHATMQDQLAQGLVAVATTEA